MIPSPSPSPPAGTARGEALTSERQAAFLEALANTGSVSLAAKYIGCSRAAVYKLRHHPDADAFRAGWTQAIGRAVEVMRDSAFERALEGVREPIWYKGEQVGERVRHNDRLLMFLLRAHDPATYAPRVQTRDPADAAIAAMQRQLARHERDRPADSPAQVSTVSTAPPARERRIEDGPIEDDGLEEDGLEDDAAWQEEAARDHAASKAHLRALRHPAPPQRLSKRNARRLAARQKAADG